MNLPYEQEFALRQLRPHANYRLENDVFTYWEDPTGSTAPTWQEVLDQIELNKDKGNS